MKLILKKEIIGTRRDTIPPRQTTYALVKDRAKVIFNNTTGSVHDLDNLQGHFVCENWRKYDEFIVFPNQVEKVIIERESEVEEIDIAEPTRTQLNYTLMQDDSFYPE